MKKIALFLSITMLFMLGSVPMNRSGSEVILNADQVTSAVDIERAIETATNNGARSGIVTLDSSKGDFLYTGDDRSINIYYSNITLRSKNGAVLANCGDAVFFDDFVTDNITIEGIQFIGENGIIASYGTHRNVTISENIFLVNSFGVGAERADGWNITGNQVVSHGMAIHLLETTEARIEDNVLIDSAQGIGVFLEKSNANFVGHNMIVNGWQGVLIGWGSSGNRVTGNRIYRIQQSGISFEGNNSFNNIIANKISCQTGVDCLVVSVGDPPLSTTNKVQGNKFIR